MATSTDLRSAIEEVQNQLPADQVDGADLEGAYEADFTTRIEQRIGALPWWVISAVVHSVLFLLCTLIGVAVPPPEMNEVTITSDIAKKEEPKYDEKKKRDVFKQTAEIEHESKVEKPILVHEEAVESTHFETANEMDSATAAGNEDAISDIPLGGFGTTGSMGVGGGGMAGVFGYRGGGGRKRAIKRFGGSKATESAVEAALRWLARHQEADGHWAGEKWDSKKDKRTSMAMTGLATLAFLGAGYTHKTGKFRDNVNRAVKWMISQQDENGGLLGKKGYRYPHYDGYCHSMGAMALVEAYGMSKDPTLKEAAQKTVNYTVNVHQKPYSGWRYKPGQEGDISHTGWFIMQLKSAKVAGLKVDGAAFQGGMNFVQKILGKKTGKSVYEMSQIGSANYGGGLGTSNAARRTSISMVCRMFMGVSRDDEVMLKGHKWVLACKPDWEKRDFYGLYYGTLAMFQSGGDSWKEWNKAMAPMLVDNQCKGGPMDGSTNDVDGSWIADKGSWGCGRTFSTALGALSLEVYYRYLPMYNK
jgi:hypothetical protein